MALEDLIKDGSAVLFLMLGWGLFQRLLNNHIFTPLSIRYVQKPLILIEPTESTEYENVRRPPTPPPDHLSELTRAQNEYKNNLAKFSNAAFKFIAYTTILLVGITSIIGDDKLEALKTGNSTGWMARGIISIFQDWPNMEFYNIIMPGGSLETSPIIFHYQLALAFYLYGSVMMCLGLDGTPKSDYLAMGTHHAVTIFLILFSWYWKLARYGCIILILHDVSDPFMEIAKTCLYSGKQLLADIGFGLFALVFLVSRCFVFPVFVMWPLFDYLFRSDVGYAKAQTVPYWYFGPLALVMLQLLHLFWGGLILKMLFGAISKGKVDDDIREKEE